MRQPVNIAVIGAGIIGLSTSYKILEDFSNCKVTVFFDDCSPNTTGDISAGYVFPYACNDNRISKWIKLTTDHLANIFKKRNAFKIGVQPTSGYVGVDIPPDIVEMKAFPFLQPLMQNESAVLSVEGQWWKLTTWICQCNKYLPWLTDQIESLGGKLVKRHINCFEELHSYDLIVNCTGLSAKYLTDDDKLIPVRGQVMIVKAPWLNHMILKLPWYILPTLNNVILGGTSQKGDSNTTVDPSDSKMIWEECCKLNPSVQYSEVVEERVGLRPHREPIRLELEDKWLNGKKVPILHNYGHGGSGVALHWGCAVEASEILKQRFKWKKIRSSL